jgi:hypothetical protein
MYFGFSNAPSTFQGMMNHILEDLIRGGKVMVYLDDILIFGNDRKEHRRLVTIPLGFVLFIVRALALIDERQS